MPQLRLNTAKLKKKKTNTQQNKSVDHKVSFWLKNQSQRLHTVWNMVSQTENANVWLTSMIFILRRKQTTK